MNLIKNVDYIEQVKYFQGGDEENKINEWLKDNPDIELKSITQIPMFDRYVSSGEICNQWIDTIIIYKKKVKKNLIIDGRIIEKYDISKKEWEKIDFKDLHNGDVFRIFDNGERYINKEDDNNVWIATGEPYIHKNYKVLTINTLY